jgi:hypothetical protein
MATIVLQAAGAFLGGFLGPVGTAIGSAAGALAGYYADRALIQGTRRVEGPRLASARPFTAEEGAPMPRVYGAARLGGTLIWATRFEESHKTERRGAKGGPKVTTYSYFANVAFAICEGPIAGVRRVWADGREIDLERVEMRLHTGGEDQLPDPLIEAKQGAGNAPSYRGTAYVVFERFPLEDFGNRIPQLQFEVLRPVGTLHERVRAVALIPGSTEYGLSPDPVIHTRRKGESEPINRHVLHGPSDLTASLDELQALCPNLENVALVATWFGNDLRAGHCLIRPGVTQTAGAGFSRPWIVSGTEREAAYQVSRHTGGAAYGGTPSDRSVMDAIAEIKARGLKVTLYPFVMMDVPAGNGLPDPYGGAEQAAYPWRGRITCDPAPGQPGSADKGAAARSQVEDFAGGALSGDFAASGDTVLFSGSPDDWGYRRLVLHYAHLAKAAGGVDAFLLGSELRALTALRDAGNAFPFVEQLAALAGEVRDILGPEAAITYGADWSEYFGHQPADGSGDVFFHLDALWTHPAVSAVGIDNYMPLADWRDTDCGGGSPDGFSGPYDPAGLRRGIAGGEGFDWFYADEAARQARQRSPITDGAHSKPWVFRYKDIASWWSNPHYDRIGGVEAGAPTAWVPRSKPVWFTELGCPAVDKGPNQPNVFSDPKSSEAALPHFSSGGRSDLAQRRFLAAHFDRWDGADESFEEADNPVSPLYGGRMIEASRIYLWAWDARPFPAFPLRRDVWSDGDNWLTGHWLNGRLAGAEVGDLVNAILAEHGLPAAETAGADGTLHGYVVSDPATARAAIEPLADLFGLAVREEAGLIRVASAGAQTVAAAEIGALVVEGGAPAVEIVRTPNHDLPAEAQLIFRDPLTDYQQAAARQVHGGGGGGEDTLAFPGMLEPGEAEALLASRLRRVWHGREQASFAVAAADRALAPGAVFRLPEISGTAEYLVTAVEEGLARRISARGISRLPPFPQRTALPGGSVNIPVIAGKPLALFLDLPMTPGSSAPEGQLRVAAWAKPWRPQALFVSPEETGFSPRGTVVQATTTGELAAALPAGAVREGRIDEATVLLVRLFGSALSSVSRLQMLNGANAAAIRSAGGQWEIVQFQNAEEIEPDLWRVTGLLRGQLGTGDAAAAGAPEGAAFVLLDQAVAPAGLLASEIGIELNWQIGPSGHDLSSEHFETQSVIGGVRALTPLAPAHLRARRMDGGDLAVTWIRRGRINADSWLGPDIPLGEESERYRIEVRSTAGTVVRATEVAAPGWTYLAADMAIDSAAGSEADLVVRQIGAAIGPGLPAVKRISTS